MITDPKRHLKLSDVAGLPVGHAPRGLSSVFRKLIETNHKIYAEPTGEPRQSFPPWPKVFEKGGGSVIPCNYTITCTKVEKDVVRSMVREEMNKMPEKDCMTLV